LFCQRFAVDVGLATVSGITEVREAIRKLPAQEAWQLASKLRDHLDALWDEQFEKDVEEGRFEQMIARTREEHDGGKTRSTDEIVGDK
jgi:hypothetical protein